MLTQQTTAAEPVRTAALSSPSPTTSRVGILTHHLFTVVSDSTSTPRLLPRGKRTGVAAICAGLALIAWSTLGESVYQPYVFTTIAGRAGVSGNTDGLGSTATFFGPTTPALDDAGSLYLGDLGNHTIRRLSLVGTNWIVTTVAGKPGVSGIADGVGNGARFNHPCKVALDNAGNIIVPDRDNGSIRKLAPVGTDWVVTTLAGKSGSLGNVDGTNNTARFKMPVAVAVDPGGNIYVADPANNNLRKLTQDGTNWVVTTLAPITATNSDTQATNQLAHFNGVNDVAADLAGNLYVTESSHVVRRLTPVGTNWVLTTVAGLAGRPGSADGPASVARFNDPESLAVDTAGNIYVADWGDYTVRKIGLEGTNWVVRTLGGRPGAPGSKDGIGGAARFRGPTVAVDSVGNLFEADFTDNWVIRRAVPAIAIRSWQTNIGPGGFRFGFDLAGPAGQAVVIEASTDFATWTAIATNTLTGPLTTPSSFDDPGLLGSTHRFYRLQAR